MGDYNAILIVGPAGSRKNSLAVSEAQKRGGGYIVALWDRIIFNRFGLGEVMRENPKTVIVDWFSFGCTQKEAAFIKSLVGGDSIMVEEKYQEPRIVKAPFFIFLSIDMPSRNEVTQLVMRGWKVIEIDSAATEVAKRLLEQINGRDRKSAYWLVSAVSRLAKEKPDMSMDEFLSILQEVMPKEVQKVRDGLKQKGVI